MTGQQRAAALRSEGPPGPSPALTLAGRHRTRLFVVLALTTFFMGVEVAGGLVTHSLALLADAGHMLADVLALSWALVAIQLARRPPHDRWTFGYLRAEVLAALANALLVFGVCVYIAVSAAQRLRQPSPVLSTQMLTIGTVGLVVNVIGAGLLYHGAQVSLNVKGAFMEVLADLAGSLAVIGTGVIILLTGWWYADTLFSFLIGLLLIPGAWKLLRDAGTILLEGAPHDLDASRIGARMAEVRGVTDIHELHVWAITSGYVNLTAHVRLGDLGSRQQVQEELQRRLWQEFGIEHVTLQLEEPGSPACTADSGAEAG